MTWEWRHHDVTTEGHICPSSPLTRDGHICPSSPVRVKKHMTNICVSYVIITFMNRYETDHLQTCPAYLVRNWPSTDMPYISHQKLAIIRDMPYISRQKLTIYRHALHISLETDHLQTCPTFLVRNWPSTDIAYIFSQKLTIYRHDRHISHQKLAIYRNSLNT